MRTLQLMLPKKAEQPKTRRLSFREFCPYVYEPTEMLKRLNLPEGQEKEIEEAIKNVRS